MHTTIGLETLSRRDFVRATSAIMAFSLSGEGSRQAAAQEGIVKPAPEFPHQILTPAAEFRDVSRGNPKPYLLTGEALVQARLTPETWRLEVTADTTVNDAVKLPASMGKALTLADGTALDLPALQELGRRHGVKFLKAMQCLNIPTPLGQGLWEGVPLCDVLRLCGRLSNFRRIYYWGFHNDDPKQLFRSSLSYSQAMETPPGELPAFLAYRLNGEPLSLQRGGPVRMIIPWAHGFKSIKWLQHIALTNDYRANDTYADANNDPESHLKTAAYLDEFATRFPTGQAVLIRGLAISGWSGLKRVEYWLRPSAGAGSELADDDPAWGQAIWIPCQLAEPPADWSSILPADVPASDVLGFDRKTGQPRMWPLRYGMVSWSARLSDLAPGKYEVRARTVDLNNFAQPEPRPQQKAGKNPVQMRRFVVEG